MNEREESSTGTSVEQRSRESAELKANLIRRLNRIEGQVRGIKGMIERDVTCDDILNQMTAVQSALHAVSKLLLESHIKTCVMERLQQGDQGVTAELMKTLSKLIK